MIEQTPVAYHTVFQVGIKDLLLNLLWLILPIAFFLMGVKYVRASGPEFDTPPSRMPTIRSELLTRIVGVALIVFSLLMVYATGWSTIANFLDLRAVGKNRGYHVVEGPVESFVSMPYQGHAVERFAVGGVPFSYSTYEVTNCFNHTSSFGGPIRAGLQVRISYVGSPNRYRSNCILKLEVADQPR